MEIHLLSTTGSPRLGETERFWQEQGWQTRVWLNDGRFPSHGRNRILTHWREHTAEEWCCIADDDITLFAERSETQAFLKDPYTLLNQLPPQMSVFTAMNGIRMAVNQIQQNTPELRKGWLLQQTWEIGKIYWIRRTPQPFLQRTDLLYAEDHEWACQQIKQGYMTAVCLNLVVRERGASELFRAESRSKSQAQRTRDMEKTQARLIELYPDFRMQNGVLERKKFMRRYSVLHQIPRTVFRWYQHRMTPERAQFERWFEEETVLKQRE